MGAALLPAHITERQDNEGWTPQKLRGDSWKYKGEKPVLTIDAANVNKYLSKLSAGQIALIKQIKGYNVVIYPTHRSCGTPDFVAENTKKILRKQKLIRMAGR